ncbi:flavodoxin family protein [Enteractinococcus fodinae]|uniref:Flavorubredoxin n=1 Tax=Enteractinococcus fodinae TaxID=684663 RepID=A0ABU2AXF1_9MICC|nr:flavodoxin domain-containing protein [Enteractinococcus fodinae]MDR7346025.1 flavorubredoxin [Enteractinococcus fodinae]
MRALIIYESAWGNTTAVAEAVSEGLTEHDIEVDVRAVQDAPALHQVQVDLLVVGAPTHAFGLSREATRQEAHNRGGELIATGVREWLESGPVSLSVATFDTHVRRPNLPGHASRKAAKKLKKLGCTLLVDPESFDVEDYEGPLSPGELERARQWGIELGRKLTEQSHRT